MGVQSARLEISDCACARGGQQLADFGNRQLFYRRSPRCGYTLVSATDLSGTPSVSPRIVVTGNPVLSSSEQTFSQAFRTSVFQMPAVGTLGTLSKTLITGPGINNFDVSIFKNIPLYKERARAQLRGEYYNFFNHTQFSSFDNTARFAANGSQVNAQFGQYTTARDPRVMQLAVRVEF